MTKIGQICRKWAFWGQFFDENSNFSASDSKMRTSAQVCGLLSTSMRLLRMVSHREPWGYLGASKSKFCIFTPKRPENGLNLAIFGLPRRLKQQIFHDFSLYSYKMDCIWHSDATTVHLIGIDIVQSVYAGFRDKIRHILDSGGFTDGLKSLRSLCACGALAPAAR